LKRKSLVDKSEEPMTDAAAWSEIEPRTILPGMHGRFLHSASMTFVMWRFEQGASFPRHAHPHEQVVHVLEGNLELTRNNDTIVLKPGMIAVVASDVAHSGRALTECRVMDVFSPAREDYRNFDAPNILQRAAKTP
jgi:quercetin dioxygenase-like cupin family protein